MISSPTTRPLRPSTAHGYTSSQASGPPSDPCLGASFRVLSADRITPTGRSSTRTNASDSALALIVRSSYHDKTAAPGSQDGAATMVRLLGMVQRYIAA